MANGDWYLMYDVTTGGSSGGTTYATACTTTWVTYPYVYAPSPPPKEEKKLPKGVEMKKLYEVYLIYGEDRKAPTILTERVIADSEEDAKVKSGLHKFIDPTWESDFLTFEAVEIIDVKVKERPREVKNV